MINKYVRCYIDTNFGVFEFYGELQGETRPEYYSDYDYLIKVLKKIRWPNKFGEPAIFPVASEEMETIPNEELEVAEIILG